MTGANILAIAAADIRDGLARTPLWRYMAQRELKLRYARSFIGPFWITLALGTWLLGLSLVYGGLFGAPLKEISPYILLGMVPWTFLAATANDGASCLVRGKNFMMQAKMPASTFVFLVVFRNLIVGAHHMMIFVVLVFVFQMWPNLNWLWILVGLPLLFFTGLGIALFVAVLTPRFRDIEPLVSNLTTIGFFLSPVMWRPDDLVRNEFVAEYNPFTHILEVFRAPLLGEAPDPQSLVIAGATAAIAMIAGLFVLGAYRRRIAFWL